MDELILQVNHLSKSFGTHEVLRDIDFTVNKGDVTSIIGASGSGKSTLLRCINLLETPTSGEILYHGKNVVAKGFDAPSYRSHVGMVFQSFNLFNNMTVLENCIVGQVQVLKRGRAEAKDHAMLYLEKVGMTPYINAKPRQISGGQKQRVAIARIFLMNPPILILDEATSALDNESEILVGQSLEKLAHGRTTLTIAHRLTTIKNYDRILVLGSDGIEESGTHDELLAQHGVYYRLWNQLPGKDTL